eukprot:9663505-Alexandrium_andersonii.AAC.1
MPGAAFGTACWRDARVEMPAACGKGDGCWLGVGMGHEARLEVMGFGRVGQGLGKVRAEGAKGRGVHITLKFTILDLWPQRPLHNCCIAQPNACIGLDIGCWNLLPCCKVGGDREWSRRVEARQ